MNEKTDNLYNKPYLKPRRIFEKSGFVDPEMSYYVPLDNVVNSDNQDIKTMVDRGRYFSIFAPRQSGKTTFLERMRAQLHQDKTYIAIILSFLKFNELGKTEFYSSVEVKLYGQLLTRLEEVECEKTATVRQFLDSFHLSNHISFSQLFEKLNQIIQFKKTVIFIDEFDGIPSSELGNFLHSLRDLYQEYKAVKRKALYSVGLIGIRNITKLVVGGVSPFNIADHVELPPFSLKNIQDLYAQYTTESNQPFTQAAIKKVYEETAGQTWLVNRLGTILTTNIKPSTTEAIDETDVENAIQLLLYEENDHFDNLYEKAKLYKETFVEIVFDHVKYRVNNKDQSWLEQYGLIKRKDNRAVVANSIYRRRFTETFFDEMDITENLQTLRNGLLEDRLDMEMILLDFANYIAQIGVRAFYQENKPYEKVGQFLLTAWLYPFISHHAGELRYEVHSGLGRMDVFLNYKGKKYIIETKVNHYIDISVVLKEGIHQVTDMYLATENVTEGYLVIFDPRTPVGTSLTPEYHQAGDKKVTIIIIGIGKAN